MSAPALFEYQRAGATFLAERRYAALFDEMGVGKTAQAIHAANIAHANRILVISPHIGLINWQREIAMWGWRKDSAILTNRDPNPDAHWHVVNYDLLQGPSLVLQALQSQHYDLLILDECQALKNFTATRTANIYGRRGVARNADRVWPVSGSPCPNHVGELYPHLLACFPHILEREKIKNYAEFIRHYCRVSVNSRGEDVVIGSNGARVAELKERLAPFMLRRTLKEVLPDLPALRFSTVHLDPLDALAKMENAPEQAECLMALQAAAAKFTDVDADDAFLLALYEMEGEYLSTQRRLYGLAKVPIIADMVHKELRGGLDKIVIFYHHRDVGRQIAERLSRFGSAAIDGRTVNKFRQPIIDEFQTKESRRVLCVGLDCGATVITLTAAAHVLFAECSWTPLTNVQAARRCARLGQTRPVLARFASLAGSLDEIIIAVQARKARALAYLFETSDNPEKDHAARSQ